MHRRVAIGLALVAGLAGCRDMHRDPSAPPDALARDAASDAPPDAALPDDGDGKPLRIPCSKTLGNALPTNTYGRLDGILVAVIPPTGPKACGADDDHYHLRVFALGDYYDISINISADVHTTTLDRKAFTPWADGFHEASSDIYVDYTGLGIHADTIPLSTPAALADAITADMATVNHISIYASTYNDGTGAHLVHFNGGGQDGLIVTKPLSPKAHMRAFSFTNQAF